MDREVKKQRHYALALYLMVFIFWASKSTSLNRGAEFLFFNECTERFMIFIILYSFRHRYLVSSESTFKDLSYCFVTISFRAL